MPTVDTFTGRVTGKLDSYLFAGGGLSSDIPSKWPVALDGRPYMIDTQPEHTFTDYWRHESIQLVRTQADTSGQPQEASLNPEGLWRRAQDSWHHGTGQAYRDRDQDADPYRYHASKGLDPWTRYLLQMLPDTSQTLSSANTNLALCAAGARLYALDGTAVKYSTDANLGSTVTSTGSNSKLSICSDGTTVYFTDGSDVYSTTTSTTSASVYNTLDCTIIAYVKGRLMAAKSGAIYNITSGSVPSALFTQGSINNTSFTWVGFAEGRQAIYAAGYSGDKCVDDQTEVLTQRGWMTHDQLLEDDQVLTIDAETSAITWQQPTAINRFDWDGPLERWTSARMDALTTPNHRWLVGNRSKHGGYYIDDGTPYSFATTEELQDRKYVRLVVGGGNPQAFSPFPTFTDEFVELVGWVVTEGTYPKKANSVYVAQSEIANASYVERLRHLVKHFSSQGATASAYSPQRDGDITFYFGKGIGSLLREIAPNRQLTPAFLGALTVAQAELLYETLIDGDGHRHKEHGNVTWTQQDSGRINSFQMLAAMLGKRTHSRQINNKKESLISEYRTRYTSNWAITKQPEHYQGVVWCPSTPAGTWLARRNGYTYWTGNSLIYQIVVKPDASTLDQPVVAGELPDGEIIRSIQGYLGFIVLGTDTGFRFCDVDASGNLIIGTRIATTSAVACFEPQDRFIWFGYTNYDSASTGLGRMDIYQFTDIPGTTTLSPAYSSDLMVTGSGAVLSIASFLNKRVFAVSGLGFYTESANKVATATMTTGLIGFGIPDPKTAMYLDTRTQPLTGSYAIALATDDGTATATGGTMSTASSTGTEFVLNQARGDHFEITFTLTRSGTDTTVGPVMERWTMKAFPTTNDATSSEIIYIPILLAPRVNDTNVDVDFEREAIKSLRATRKIVTYQEFTTSYTGFVEDYRWVPHHLVQQSGAWNNAGTMLVQYKRL